MKLRKAPFIAGRVILKPLGKNRQTGQPQFTSEFTAEGRSFLGKKPRNRRYDWRLQSQKAVNSDARVKRNQKQRIKRSTKIIIRNLKRVPL